MSYSSDLTNEQWALLERVVDAPDKRGPKHAPDLRGVAGFRPPHRVSHGSDLKVMKDTPEDVFS